MAVCSSFSGNKWHYTFVNVSFLFSIVNSNIYLHSLFKNNTTGIVFRLVSQGIFMGFQHCMWSIQGEWTCRVSRIGITSVLDVPKTSDCMHMWTGTNHKSLQDRPGKLRSETSAVDSITFETDHDTAVNLRVSIWFLSQ